MYEWRRTRDNEVRTAASQIDSYNSYDLLYRSWCEHINRSRNANTNMTDLDKQPDHSMKKSTLEYARLDAEEE